MDVRIGIPEVNVKAGVLNAGLEAVTRLNEDLIRTGKVPTFDQGIANGIKWKPEPPGLESFDHAGTVHRRGWGDCDDLAPWHAATLRASGEDPDARAIVYKSGPHRWHAITERGDGTTEDPSQTAGMRGGSKGIPPAVVSLMDRGGLNGEERPYVAVSRDSGAWVGRTDLPLARTGGCALSVTHRDATPARALAGSMKGATILGGCSRMGVGEHLDKMWALQGLLSGQSLKSVAGFVGVETTKDAVRTLAELCPAILTELQAHRRAVEGSPHSGRPF